MNFWLDVAPWIVGGSFPAFIVLLVWALCRVAQFADDDAIRDHYDQLDRNR